MTVTRSAVGLIYCLYLVFRDRVLCFGANLNKKGFRSIHYFNRLALIMIVDKGISMLLATFVDGREPLCCP